ncbi:OmpA family protein [Hyunsoonleella pacifica]|uniref:Flagellar motor protein MotB n=1 Tax=Hyunsoonleella pacifica TaxID=1080224 RepID=A0A4Q9FSY4_9FLAO|nr:OmpA family protein [Hyunsoonleella pacifica]TBN18489.1 flagellar motor protein MotB [Hyunsoonleella pacifica]GGD02185.1 cell envelope biogenesis protein OmpA [Hyunsoonleella pacifica]
MKKRIYILSVLTVFMFGVLNAQKGKVSTAVKKYDKLSYVDSRAILLELANKEDASFEVVEKLANAFYFNSEMEDASKWYAKLIEISSNTYPENYFRYAQTLKALGKYKEADDVFRTFATLRPDDSRGIEFLNNTNYLDAIETMSQDYILENLDINTSFSDFGASLNDGNLVFASSRDQDEKIYNWNAQPFLDIFELDVEGNIQEIKGDINTKYHESSTAYTKDGNTVYFTRNNFFNGKFKKNSENTHALKIYKATLIDGMWTNVKSLPFNDDEYSVAHPTLSVDEKKLYFASDMPGTNGMSDIFVVDINEDGTYGDPLNLGSKINTEGRENFPFVSDKGVLYFSSDGHLGLGGLDVFSIEVNDLKTGVLKNVGKPINSPKDDFAYIINETTRKGYISSNRKGGKGDDDIYSFEIPDCKYDITGIVVNKKTSEILVNADIVLKDENNNILESVKSDNSGKFEFNLSCKEQTYIIEAQKEKFEDDFTDFTVKTGNSGENLKLALEPSAAKIGTDLALLLNLNPIYFDYDKSFIRPDAEIELAKVIKYMKEYPSVKIDVRSHTDSRGRDAYNMSLSQRRNKSTREYIINEGGISADRISGRGYGETRLTNRCSNGVKCSKTEHQANRRSEFIVVEN